MVTLDRLVSGTFRLFGVEYMTKSEQACATHQKATDRGKEAAAHLVHTARKTRAGLMVHNLLRNDTPVPAGQDRRRS